jgi:hypothetical protein
MRSDIYLEVADEIIITFRDISLFDRLLKIEINIFYPGRFGFDINGLGKKLGAKYQNRYKEKIFVQDLQEMFMLNSTKDGK